MIGNEIWNEARFHLQLVSQTTFVFCPVFHSRAMDEGAQGRYLQIQFTFCTGLSHLPPSASWPRSVAVS